MTSNLFNVCMQPVFAKRGKPSWVRFSLCYDEAMCYYDIPEDLWLRLEPILPTEGSPRGGRPTGDIRNFLNAVHWMLRTGIRVEIGGSEAYTDGKVIHLPSLQLEVDESLAGIARRVCGS